MNAIEIARTLAGLGQKEEAQRAYTLAIHQSGGEDPAAEMEAAVYLLQSGGNYKISYTCFRDLYNRGEFQEDILEIMTAAFYEPNVKLLKSRYERNCKLLEKYPYCFRRDFLPFEELPIRFYPYDDNGYMPYRMSEKVFGDYVNPRNPVVSQNFFHDLENPILAKDVYSQYELEYLRDNVRRSEYVARENHIYLHYTDWAAFCAHLQILNLRPLLEEQKLVFLIEEEIAQYPIDFKERFGIDYSQNALRPVGVGEITRLIWHTQLSTHNGGDFFNEIFDGHPNVMVMPSMMMDKVQDQIEKVRGNLKKARSLEEAMQIFKAWKKPYLVEELYRGRGSSDKNLLAAMFLCEEAASDYLDPASRIAPALFFQPHFSNMNYDLSVNAAGQAVLHSAQYEAVRKSAIFQDFPYIKTFTPMRRPTTSHAATVKFMYGSALKAKEENKEKKSVVSDALFEHILNRSFMLDPEDRLYKDSILVRFEDGKLNPKATFTALAAFLDIPYTESMTYCSHNGMKDPESMTGNARGFDPVTVYRTYDDYTNDAERCFMEYFMRDVYEYYGYSFHYYDGGPMDEARAEALIDGFDTINHYMRETWKDVFNMASVSMNGMEVDVETETSVQKKLLDNYMNRVRENRVKNMKILMKGLYFVNKRGQPLRMSRRLELDPQLLEQPLYR